MADVALATPPLLYVGWDCTRCGHKGGRAHTTVPFYLGIGSEIRDALMAELMRTLARKHLQRQGCQALPQDFVVYRLNRHGDRAA